MHLPIEVVARHLPEWEVSGGPDCPGSSGPVQRMLLVGITLAPTSPIHRGARTAVRDAKQNLIEQYIIFKSIRVLSCQPPPRHGGGVIGVLEHHVEQEREASQD